MSLSNFQLETLAKELNIKLDGVYMKNELNFRRTIGNYIINLDDSGNQGTHWCVLIVEKRMHFGLIHMDVHHQNKYKHFVNLIIHIYILIQE